MFSKEQILAGICELFRGPDKSIELVRSVHRASMLHDIPAVSYTLAMAGWYYCLKLGICHISNDIMKTLQKKKSVHLTFYLSALIQLGKQFSIRKWLYKKATVLSFLTPLLIIFYATRFFPIGHFRFSNFAMIHRIPTEMIHIFLARGNLCISVISKQVSELW